MNTSAEGITQRTEFDQLKVNAAIRQALETAARAVEGLSGNRHYLAAFKAAARTIRNQKPD